MKIALCFLAVVSCTVAMPAEVPFEALEELDTPSLIPNNVYVESANPVKTIDSPGSRVIGGAELAPGAAPYQVAIITDGNKFCGGSLISTTRVLTVAIYINSASYVQVRLGATNYNQFEDTQVRLTSTNIIIHENYTSYLYPNDIGLIILPTAVTLTDYIKVVNLAPANADNYGGSWGFLSGWGYTTSASSVIADVLRGVYLTVMTNEQCRSIYGSVVLDSHLCTSGSGIVGGCFYDNGSPLVVNTQLQAQVQIGFAAFFPTTCDNGNPTGFIRISSFRSWIDQHTGV